MNWTRLKVQPVERAMLRARMVLPTPGTSSISTWPWQTRAMTAIRTSSCLPTITFSTLSMMRSTMILGSSTGVSYDSAQHKGRQARGSRYRRTVESNYISFGDDLSTGRGIGAALPHRRGFGYNRHDGRKVGIAVGLGRQGGSAGSAAGHRPKLRR